MKNRAGKRVWGIMMVLLTALFLALGLSKTVCVQAATGTVADPIAIKIDATYYEGSLSKYEEKWYQIEIPSTGKAVCTLNGNTWIRCRLYQKNSLNWTMYDFDVNKSTGSSSWILSKGTYYIELSAGSNYAVDYLLGVDFTSYGTTTQDTTTQDSPLNISLNQTVISAITKTDTEQWYKISLPSTGKYTFTYNSDHADQYITIYNHNLQSVQDLSTYGVYTFSKELKFDAGTYYIQCRKRGSWWGAYRFIIKRVGATETVTPTPTPTTAVTRPAATTITSLTNVSSGIRLGWKKVSNVSGYLIYRKSGSSPYYFVASIANDSTVTYTDTSVKSKNGTGYTYRIYTYKGSVNSNPSKTKYIIRMTPVQITSVSNAKGAKAVVKWTKNTKASGYQINIPQARASRKVQQNT